MLCLAGVSKRYGWGKWILQDIDLEIPAGQVVAINGANGSGKSTLSRSISRTWAAFGACRPAWLLHVQMN